MTFERARSVEYTVYELAIMELAIMEHATVEFTTIEEAPIEEATVEYATPELPVEKRTTLDLDSRPNDNLRTDECFAGDVGLSGIFLVLVNWYPAAAIAVSSIGDTVEDHRLAGWCPEAFTIIDEPYLC